MKIDKKRVIPDPKHAAGTRSVLVPPIVEPSQHGSVVDQSIRNSAELRGRDPNYRFHETVNPSDIRRAVAAGEAVQRLRGRHFEGSLRAQPKKSSP